MSTLQQKITACPPDALAGIRRGIEKEGLRVLPTGDLALTPHPAALGSALTHPHITTDYSESQIELITGAQNRPCLAAGAPSAGCSMFLIAARAHWAGAGAIFNL